VSARSILIAIALSAWLLASVVAFFIVAYMSFFGVAFIGLVICYVSAQFELDGDRPASSARSCGRSKTCRLSNASPSAMNSRSRCNRPASSSSLALA